MTTQEFATTQDFAPEIITDLLRSAWISESARARVYAVWASTDARFVDFVERTEERARLFEKSLFERGRTPDMGLVDAHAAWLRKLVGERAGETALADLFLVRLGDWVEAHASSFLTQGAETVAALGERNRSALEWPDQLPPSPPYERVEAPAVERRGDVKFRFGILGDLHIGSPPAEALARAAVADLNASGAELVIQLGDITDRGNKDEFDLARDILTDLKMPVTTMMGNHDVFSYKEDRLSGREYYPASFGREPDGVVLEHQGVRFAVLDSAESAASPFGPFNLVSGSFVEGPRGAIVRGALTVPQHEILADVAAPGGRPTFVFLHHPPQPFTGFPPVVFGLRDADSGRIHATCDSGNVWGVFAGHSHRNARTTNYGAVPVMEVATPRDYPFGFALVEVGDTGYAYRFVQISDDALLRDMYRGIGLIQRRYGRGSDEELSFSWRNG